MQIPQEIKKFIDKKIIFDNRLIMPWFYPETEKFDDFQSGYKIDGEDEDGILNFKKSWWVVCRNYFDDPYFVDFAEQEKGFPVYFAYHGMGKWTPILVSETIVEFENILSKIKPLENKKIELLNYLRGNFDLENPLWRELFDSVLEEDEEESDKQIDTEPLIFSKLYITDFGENKLHVIKHLKKFLGLTPKQALTLPEKLPIKYREGLKKLLVQDMDYLQRLGVKCELVDNDSF